jgi:hypothetical protein
MYTYVSVCVYVRSATLGMCSRKLHLYLIQCHVKPFFVMQQLRMCVPKILNYFLAYFPYSERIEYANVIIWLFVFTCLYVYSHCTTEFLK